MSLDELRALEQAATPGPWRAHGDHWVFDAEDQAVFAGAMLVTDDARFIVAARNALPGLLGRVAAAEAERDALRTALKAMVDAEEEGALPVEERRHATFAEWRAAKDAALGAARAVRAAPTTKETRP